MQLNRPIKIGGGGLLVLPVLVFGLFMFTSSSGATFVEREATVATIDSSLQKLTETPVALDCRDKDERCTRTELEVTVQNCNEWYTGEPIDKLECDKTSQGIEAISLLTDHANHVRSSFTTLSYTTEVLTPSFGLEGQSAGLPTEGWDLEFLPDGTALVSANDGQVLHYQDGRFRTILDLDVIDIELTGLMGLEVLPDDSGEHAVYLLYTYESAGRDGYLVHNRLSRFTFVRDSLVDEEVLLDEIPGSVYHSGGRLEQGPDGKLYATTGDADDPKKALDKGFLGGKILRLNPDGSVPSDNPYSGKYMYSRGHRNPQGLAWHPTTGTLYATEHGDWRHDEVNRVVPGGNYGWGRMRCDEVRDEGIDTDGRLRRPIRCFDQWTFAPSGTVFVDEAGHPWENDLFVAGLRGNHLRRFVLRNGTLVQDEIFYLTRDASDIAMGRRLRDVEFHDGSLWVLSDWRGIVRLSPDE